MQKQLNGYIFNTHSEAEEAMRLLSRSGMDGRQSGQFSRMFDKCQSIECLGVQYSLGSAF